MDNVLNMSGFPPEAKASIIDFYEFLKQKYSVHDRKKSKPGKKLIALMERGMYTLPDDYVFDREELYD